LIWFSAAWKKRIILPAKPNIVDKIRRFLNLCCNRVLKGPKTAQYQQDGDNCKALVDEIF